MDRNTEFVGTERQLLTQFLDSQRGGVLDAVAGLTSEQLHRRMVGSATTIGALLKHLALVEDSWFQEVLLDQELPEPWMSAPLDDDPDWDFHSAAADQPGDLVALYSAACQRSRLALQGCESLDIMALAIKRDQAFSLRWIVIHLIEETAQHLGHMDILRELILDAQPATSGGA